MRCARCDRALTKAAASIETKNGPLSWGPTCAKYVVVKPNRALWSVVGHRRVARVRVADPNQLQLLEVA